MTIALIFPGQGAQNVGMGRALVKRSPVAAEVFAQASEILGYDLLIICESGPAEQLSRTEFSQPALFVHSYASMKQLELERPELWQDVGSVAGLSLGEYTAVAAAGGMGFADGVRLVQARGQAMQAAADAVASGMTSIIGLERDALDAICAEVSTESHLVRVANLLCPGNIALSGHVEALELAEQQCSLAGAMKTIRLNVAGAFHTPIMQSAVALLEQAMATIEFSELRVPVFSNVDAAAHTRPDQVKYLLPQQVVAPVLWEQSLRNMLDAGIEQFIEVGTGRVLAGTLKRINRKIPCDNFGDT